MESDYAIVLTTCGSRAEAETLADRLVQDHTAACVNMVGNVTSVYEWQGRTEKSAEVLLVIKTRTALVGRVEQTIKELSLYDCPEVVVLPVIGGSPEYLAWLTETTSGE